MYRSKEGAPLCKTSCMVHKPFDVIPWGVNVNGKHISRRIYIAHNRGYRFPITTTERQRKKRQRNIQRVRERNTERQTEY